jgi:IS5 family transposase
MIPAAFVCPWSRHRNPPWTKKHGRSFFGYKNHVNAAAKHKLIRHYAVTDAAMHDSQELEGLLDTGNTCNDVFADSAYRSDEIEAKLRASGYNSRIHRRGRRNHPLSLAQVWVNYAKSRIRARIEHVFGAQQNAPGGRIVRTIGIVRVHAKIGLQEPGLQHSPPGDAGTACRGMKTVESSAVFQPKQWAEKEARKTIENRT